MQEVLLQQTKISYWIIIFRLIEQLRNIFYSQSRKKRNLSSSGYLLSSLLESFLEKGLYSDSTNFKTLENRNLSDDLPNKRKIKLIDECSQLMIF